MCGGRKSSKPQKCVTKIFPPYFIQKSQISGNGPSPVKIFEWKNSVLVLKND